MVKFKTLTYIHLRQASRTNMSQREGEFKIAFKGHIISVSFNRRRVDMDIFKPGLAMSLLLHQIMLYFFGINLRFFMAWSQHYYQPVLPAVWFWERSVLCQGLFWEQLILKFVNPFTPYIEQSHEPMSVSELLHQSLPPGRWPSKEVTGPFVVARAPLTPALPSD